MTEQVSVQRVAAIDLGTVSSRLALAEVRAGEILSLEKHAVITDLGADVDATGRFREDAVARVAQACADFVRRIRAFGAQAVSCTLTSAARDAANAATLLDRLTALGLDPQVIPGEVEARLTFFGVAHDFPGERIAVADSGGGSTEIAVGRYDEEAHVLDLERVQSLDIGCRRVTDRFLHADPPAEEDVLGAGTWVCEQFGAYWDGVAARPDRLVAVGGTVTTLVALVHNLEPYDSAFVHLHELSRAEIESQIVRMRALSAAQIAELPGIQPKRAPVIRAGAVILRELMYAGGYRALTVSENSLLAGAVATIDEVLRGVAPTVGWTPALARLV